MSRDPMARAIAPRGPCLERREHACDADRVGRVTLSRRIAAFLERGSSNPGLVALGALYGAASNPVRPLRLPPGARVIGVGGATLGGSYKTPSVVALAAALVGAGLRTAVVAPRYTTRTGAPRVTCGDVADEGDEAALASLALGPLGVPVLVGRDRTATISMASCLAPVVLLDGVLQTRPRRLGCSLLVVDAEAPLGGGRCPPAGDLRALPGRLFEAADLVLAIQHPGCQNPLGAFGDAVHGVAPLQVYLGESRLRGAREVAREPVHGSTFHDLAELRSLRVGVALAIARPERVVRALARAGIRPQITWLVGDHSGFPGGPPRCRGLDAWLTTSKCRSKLPPALGRAPVWALEHEIRLPRSLVDGVIARLTC